MADKNGIMSNDFPLSSEFEEQGSEEIRRYREILSKEPSSTVFAALAEAYRKRKLLNQAIEACKIGLRYHPDFSSGRVALARAYYDAGEIEKARHELEKVVASVPDNIMAQKLLATIYRERGDLDSLEKIIHRILSFDPQDSNSKETLRWIEDKRSGATTPAPRHPDQGEIVTKTLAEIYASQGYYEKAFEVYHKLWRQDPDNPLYHRRLADLKEKIGIRLLRLKDKKDMPEEPSEEQKKQSGE
jgi:tetratricopeptide (TPR) repeat protein